MMGAASESPLITRTRHRQHLQACLNSLAVFEKHFYSDCLVLAAEELRQVFINILI